MQYRFSRVHDYTRSFSFEVGNLVGRHKKINSQKRNQLEMLELPKRNTTKRNTHTKATLAKVVPITQERIKMKEVSDVATMLTIIVTE